MIRHSVVVLLAFLTLVSAQLQGSNSSGGNLTSSFDRLTTNNSALLVLDYQGGFATGCNDENSAQWKANLEAFMGFMSVFQLPTIMTEDTPNIGFGPILGLITQSLPNA